jgi:hypothetical protein
MREDHKLITNGVYARIRHPMYTAFWLWAIAQALLLPNWIAGLSGLIGFGTLYLLRVGPEEEMMLEPSSARTIAPICSAPAASGRNSKPRLQRRKSARQRGQPKTGPEGPVPLISQSESDALDLLHAGVALAVIAAALLDPVQAAVAIGAGLALLALYWSRQVFMRCFGRLLGGILLVDGAREDAAPGEAGRSAGWALAAGAAG